MTQYFSHDVDAQRDDKCVRLVQTLGWKGYGVYWALIERMSERDDCALENNPSGLAWSMRVPEKWLARLLTEFDLFEFSEDGATFWSNSARRRMAMRQQGREKPRKGELEPSVKRKPGRPRKNLGAPAGSARKTTKVARRTDEDVVKAEALKEEVPNVPSQVEESTEFGATDDAPRAPEVAIESESDVEETPSRAPLSDSPVESADSLPSTRSEPTREPPEEAPERAEPTAAPPNDVQMERSIDSWNAAFNGSPQEYRGFCLDAISYQRARESLSQGYELCDFQKAFRVARRDSFCWLLKDALKPDNMQRLLAKGEKRDERSAQRAGDYERADDRGGLTWGDPRNWEQYVYDPNSDPALVDAL